MINTRIGTLIVSLLFCLYQTPCFAMDVPVYDFPLSYSQQANDYLPSNSVDYTRNLVTSVYQQSQLALFYNHYYSDDPKGLSPWSQNMVTAVLPLAKTIQTQILEDFNNAQQPVDNKHYAENFKEKKSAWWETISNNIDLSAIGNVAYTEANRAISVANTYARELPDTAPDFFNASLPGQGFPFDNLQVSAIWAGTPLYIISTSKDKAWSLVLTPDAYTAWVNTRDIAQASPEFIHRWQNAARQHLVAVTQTGVSIVDKQQRFQLTGYIGAVFPLLQHTDQETRVMLPIKNRANQAVIKTGIIPTQSSTLMPLLASPQNFVHIINQLKNRPYGWGGAFFFNDCSQETKSLLTPFGIWLPRNSTAQARLGNTVDLSQSSPKERLHFLQKNGHPLMTLIHIKGHVMLYVGEANLISQAASAPITYQNVWGLPSAAHDKRYVIGQSVFLPLLENYPEAADASSEINRDKFELTYLDQLSLTPESPAAFTQTFFKAVQAQ